MPVSSQDFRNAFALAAATVAVITTDGVAGRRGLTATSFTSVSDSPPTVLACIGRGASSLPVILANGRFCLNFLGEDQAEVSDIFAGRRGYGAGERFEHARWQPGPGGLPMIAGALASFECTISRAISVASHEVLFGEVTALESEGKRPLLYAGRAYHQLG